MMYSIIVLGDINEDGYDYDATGEMIELEIDEDDEDSFE